MTNNKDTKLPETPTIGQIIPFEGDLNFADKTHAMYMYCNGSELRAGDYTALYYALKKENLLEKSSHPARFKMPNLPGKVIAVKGLIPQDIL